MLHQSRNQFIIPNLVLNVLNGEGRRTSLVQWQTMIRFNVTSVSYCVMNGGIVLFSSQEVFSFFYLKFLLIATIINERFVELVVFLYFLNHDNLIA